MTDTKHLKASDFGSKSHSQMYSRSGQAHGLPQVRGTEKVEKQKSYLIKSLSDDLFTIEHIGKSNL